MKILLTAGLLLSTTLYATEEAPSESKIVMDRVHESFVKIIPYVYSEEKLSALADKKNDAEKEAVIHTLNDISNFFKSAKHVDTFQRPGFRPSLQTIETHMQDTILSVKNNNSAYAGKRLKAMTAICLSCHSQLSSNEFAKDVPEASKNLFSRPYDYANYLLLLRRFEEATKQYEISLEQNLKEQITPQSQEEISTALKRLLSIHTKMNIDLKSAIEFVEKYKKKSNLPKVAHDNLLMWEKSLQKWKSFNLKGNYKLVDKFIKTNLKPLDEKKDEVLEGKHDVTLLISSGFLARHLNERPDSKLTPEILYWLAVAEKRLGTSYLFSLGDLYLKECIQRYPKTAYAKKCYQEYEDNTVFGYSGSAGTDIPEDEKQELKRLKGLLK